MSILLKKNPCRVQQQIIRINLDLPPGPVFGYSSVLFAILFTYYAEFLHSLLLSNLAMPFLYDENKCIKSLCGCKLTKLSMIRAFTVFHLSISYGCVGAQYLIDQVLVWNMCSKNDN
jgi:hypothetical protein